MSNASRSTLHKPPLRLPELIAHRARYQGAPENTLRGLHLCIDNHCDWVEVDVRRTADHVHVLLHDESVDRTTAGQGAVADMSLRELRTLDTGQGEPVPRLVEAIDAARGRLGLYLDCRDVDPARLVREIRDLGMEEHVMIAAGDSVLDAVRAVGGKRMRLVAFFKGDPADVAACARPGERLTLEMPIANMSRGHVEAARHAGVGAGCLAMGPDDASRHWARVAAWGVEWIMTDHPEAWPPAMHAGDDAGELSAVDLT